MASDKSDKSKGNPYAKILQIGYGVLNPISDTLTGKNFDGSDTTWFDKVRESTIRSFSPSSFEGTGPYIGIVLRDEGLTTINGVVDPSSWVAGPFSHRIVKDSDDAELAGGIDKQKLAQLPGLRQLRVRIPEIHASLPIPPDLPKRSESATDRQKEAHQVINLYPVFIAQNAAISSTEIKPGSLVWVDFQNKNTLTGGIFLSELDPKPVVEDTRGRSTSPSAAHSSEECIDRGGSEEECAVYNPSSVDYTSGGSTSDLTITLSPPLIKQGSGFPYDVIDTFNQPPNIRSNIHTHKDYGKMISKITDGALNSQRPYFWCYGVPEASQLERASGTSAQMHKLIIPRLEALGRMWDQYRNVILNGASAFAPGAAGGEVKYRKNNGSNSKRKDWTAQVYSANLTVASGYRAPTGGKSFLEAEKIKEWMVETLQTPGYTSLWSGIRKNALFGGHTSGLAIDFRGNGVNPGGATIHGYDRKSLTSYQNKFAPDEEGEPIEGGAKPTNKNWVPQYASGFYIFMLKYAWLFGFSNYKDEPWHWELRPPRQSWKNNSEYAHFSGDFDPYFSSFYVTSQITEALGSFRVLTGADLTKLGSIVTDEKLQKIYNAELTNMGYLAQEFPYALTVQEVSKKGRYAGKNLDAFGKYGTADVVQGYLKQIGQSSKLSSYKANSATINKIRGFAGSYTPRLPWFAE